MAKNSKAVVFVLLVTIGMFFTIFAFVAQQTSGSSSQPDPGATCAASQYATAETTGAFLCGSASNSNYLTTQTAVSTEASATCPIGQVAVNESASGAFSCGYPSNLHGTYPFGNLTGFPSACSVGEYVNGISASVLTCLPVPDNVQICGVTPCPLSGFFTAVIKLTGSLSTPKVTLASAATSNSFYIVNNSTSTWTICPLNSGQFLYIAGIQYTTTSCFSLPTEYQVFVWSTNPNWYGISTQILWSSLTSFPASCSPNAVITVATALTCGSPNALSVKLPWGNLTSFPAACSSGQFVNTNGGTNTCSGLLNDMQNNTKSCADTTSGVVHQMGFKLNFTTTYSTNVSVAVNFQITTPATITLNTKYRLSYGTGNAPACNAAQTGTGIGNEYELLSFGGTAATTWSQIEQFSLTAVIQAPTANTAYWVDVQALDSSGATWTYAIPTMTVIQG